MKQDLLFILAESAAASTVSSDLPDTMTIATFDALGLPPWDSDIAFWTTKSMAFPKKKLRDKWEIW